MAPRGAPGPMMIRGRQVRRDQRTRRSRGGLGGWGWPIISAGWLGSVVLIADNLGVLAPVADAVRFALRDEVHPQIIGAGIVRGVGGIIMPGIDDPGAGWTLQL